MTRGLCYNDTETGQIDASWNLLLKPFSGLYWPRNSNPGQFWPRVVTVWQTQIRLKIDLMVQLKGWWMSLQWAKNKTTVKVTTIKLSIWFTLLKNDTKQ